MTFSVKNWIGPEQTLVFCRGPALCLEPMPHVLHATGSADAARPLRFTGCRRVVQGREPMIHGLAVVRVAATSCVLQGVGAWRGADTPFFTGLRESVHGGSGCGSGLEPHFLQVAGARSPLSQNGSGCGSGLEPHFLQATGAPVPTVQTGSMSDPPRLPRFWDRIHADPCGGSMSISHFL